jgi:hypothetical protein
MNSKGDGAAESRIRSGKKTEASVKGNIEVNGC